MPKFVPRQRKHKVRKRLEQNGGNKGVPTGNDSNAAEILLLNATEKEKKRQDMKMALRAQQTKVSGKKQKRLDKYIVCCLFLSEKARTDPAHQGQKIKKGREPRPDQEARKRKSRHFVAT